MAPQRCARSAPRATFVRTAATVRRKTWLGASSGSGRCRPLLSGDETRRGAAPEGAGVVEGALSVRGEGRDASG